jgi:hypothetical protein
MDYKFYEDLLDNMVSHIYGTKIHGDEKGIFELNKNADGKKLSLNY